MLGVKQATLFKPHLVLLNLTLPDVHGLKALRDVRAETDAPVIALVGGPGEKLCLSALENGARDYLNLPASIPELMSRLEGIADPPPVTERQILRRGGLVFDFDKGAVRLGDQPVSLLPREYHMLAYMARHPGRILPHEVLLTAAGLRTTGGGAHEVNESIAALRRKIMGSGIELRDEFGMGFRFYQGAS
jgi:two-component system KDP operon response regulator KdpE